MQRYFIENSLEDEITLVDKEINHHIKNVVKNNIGEKITLVNNGKSSLYEIILFSPNLVVKKIYDAEINPELAIEVDFACGLLKKDNFELCLQKLTECGVNHIYPTKFKRNVVKYDEKKWIKKKSRYQEIIKSAAMQSQRNKIPTLNDIVNLSEINFDKYDIVITCYEDEKQNLITKLDKKIISSKKILVLIGPEGGLDIEEINWLNKLDNNNVVSLGKRILRAETAVITTMFYLSMLIEEACENSN